MQGAMGMPSPRQVGGVRQGGPGFFPSSAASTEESSGVKPEQRQSRAGGSITCIAPFSCITPLLFFTLSYCFTPLLFFALLSCFTPLLFFALFSCITPLSCQTCRKSRFDLA